MFGILKKLFDGSRRRANAPLQPESPFVVRVTDDEVVCERPDGRTERVRWDDIQAFIVETNDDGPFLPDIFWSLVGSSETSGCVFPQGTTGDQALLKRLQELPGFDNQQFIQAMSSTSNQTFVCWKRP